MDFCLFIYIYIYLGVCVFSCKKRGVSVKKVYFCVLFYDISVERLSRVMLENVGVSQKTVENFGKNFYIRVIFLH